MIIEIHHYNKAKEYIYIYFFFSTCSFYITVFYLKKPSVELRISTYYKENKHEGHGEGV